MSRPMLHLTRSSQFADDRLPLWLIRRRPQVPFPLHTHDFSELVLVLSGTGTHFTESDEYTVTAGDAFVIEGHSSHGYRNVKGLELVNILFDPLHLGVPDTDLRALPGYHALMTVEPRYRRVTGFGGRLRLETKELEHTETLIDALERELGARRPGYHSIATAYFMQIVGYLARCYSNSAQPRARSILRLADVMSYIEENVTRPIKVRELLEISGASESTLLRGFKRALGMSPTRYHLHLQLERASLLLARPELSVTEVSYRSGFSDSNYFSRQFRKMKGCTPRAFRSRAMRNGVAFKSAAGNA